MNTTNITTPTGRLGHLNYDQLRYVLRRLANGDPMPKIAKDFPYKFPNFGSGVDACRLKDILYERVRNIKRNNEDVIQALAERPGFDILPDLTDSKNPNLLFTGMAFTELDKM